MKINAKHIGSAAVVVAVGFILFNVAFLLAALIFNGTNLLLGLEEHSKPSFWGVLIYAGLMVLLTYLMFKSKRSHLVKATFMTMPLMVTLIGQAILLYKLPEIIPIIMGLGIISSIIYICYQRKVHWLYYFSTLYVGMVLVITIIFNIEI